MSCILGIDFGSRRIGLAIAETNLGYSEALPHITLPSSSRKRTKYYLALQTILEIIRRYQVIKIVIGLPLSYDPNTGQTVENKQCQNVKKFARLLRNYLKKNNSLIDLDFINEILSTQIAYKNLKSLNLGKKKIKEQIDSESARILLEDYINSIKTDSPKLH